MHSADHELRLLWAVLLNGVVLLAAYRCVLRFTSAPMMQRIADTLLLSYFVQYLAVGVTGLVGVLHPWTVSALALITSAILLALGHKPSRASVSIPVESRDAGSRWASAFAVLYLICNICAFRYQPVIDTDALVYHFPAAMNWLRSGRLSLFPTWFFNPANTYSPLAGSIFITWLLAPQGNDVIARFVQAGPLLLIYFAAVGLIQAAMAPVRSAKVGDGSMSRRWEAVIAVGVLACRPLMGEMALGKDDLFVTAFFLVAAAGLAPDRLREPLGPWRIGTALGLCLATKYTALLTVPLLLLGADAPVKEGWRLRHVGIALMVAMAIAGPWFVRNAWTGNPLFPLEIRLAGRRILPGLFQTERSVSLRSMAGVWQVLTGRYHSVPVPMALVLIAGWVAAVLGARRSAWRNPIARLCLLGPPIGLMMFVFWSPYPEVRFVFAPLALLFGAAAVAMVAWLPKPVATGTAALLLVSVSLVTGYEVPSAVASFIAVSGVGSAIIAGLWMLAQARPRWRRPIGISVLTSALAVCAIGVYVFWNAYVVGVSDQDPDADAGEDLQLIWWRSYYERESAAWAYVRQHVPAGATIAYANTSLVYPLMGSRRRVIYVPTRDGLHWPGDLPHFPERVSGETMIPTVTKLTDAEPDRAGWLRRLTDSGAAYLFVARDDAALSPPEIGFADSDPRHFQSTFSDPHYRIYKLNPGH